MKQKAVLLICLSLVFLAVGIEVYAGARTDLDWMLVSYRYSEWHRQQETWEFSPHLKMNWWDAYMFTVGRLVMSVMLIVLSLLLFFCTVYSASRTKI